MEGIASNKELHEQLQQIMKEQSNVNRTPQQIETKLRALRCLNNIPFSARAQCPGTGTMSGRGLKLNYRLCRNIFPGFSNVCNFACSCIGLLLWNMAVPLTHDEFFLLGPGQGPGAESKTFARAQPST